MGSYLTSVCNWHQWPFINFVLIFLTVGVVLYLAHRITTTAAKVEAKVNNINLKISKAQQDVLEMIIDRLALPKDTKE